jgi:hypothetical protein
MSKTEQIVISSDAKLSKSRTVFVLCSPFALEDDPHFDNTRWGDTHSSVSRIPSGRDRRCPLPWHLNEWSSNPVV